MPLTIGDIEKFVFQRIGRNRFQKVFKFISANPPRLWGEQQPRNFLRTNLLLSLYKDMNCIGFKSLIQRVRHLPFKMNHKSFQHNTEQLRRTAAEWARLSIHLGSKGEWTTSAKDVALDEQVAGISLWMDSKDFPLEGKRSVSRKSPKWSYKCNRPAQRFMFVRDGKGKIRKLWGGYSPKIYDGHWLQAQKEWLEEKLAGAVVVADNHFLWGKKHLKKVKFHCNHSERCHCREEEETDIEFPLSKAKITYNKAVSIARARIESTFGEMIQTFEALAKPWGSSEFQQECLVWIAAGIFNEDQ